MLKQLEAGGEDFVEVLMRRAKAGDPACIRIVAERLLPAPKKQAETLELDAQPGASLTQQAETLLAAATSGQIPPDAASELIRAIAQVAAVQQADELKRRLDALEFGDLA